MLKHSTDAANSVDTTKILWWYSAPQLNTFVIAQVHVSHKWKFIFVRQPKASSTAVMVAIKKQLCGLSSAKHGLQCKPDEFREVQQRLPDKLWQEYFVFTVVRNPWVRMLSAYHMFNKTFLRRCFLSLCH